MNIIKLSNLSKKEWQEVRSKYANKKKFNFEERTKNLLCVKEVLDKLKIKFWLTNGTALCAYRDHDWIKWDDDCDLDVMMEDYHANYEKIKKAFLNKGFITRGVKHKTKGKMSLFRNKEKIAIRPLYLDKKFKKNKYRLRKDYKYPKKFYEGNETIEFKGMVFNIPSPIEEFLIYVYGKKWYKPMKSDNEKEYSTKLIRR